MKTSRKRLNGLLILGGIIALAGFIQAQVNTTSVQSNPITDWASASDLDVMLQAVEQTTPVPASAVPAIGNFYSAQHPPDGPNAWPPLPGNTLDLPAWNLGDSFFLINDLNVDYDALQAQTAQAMSASPMTSMANNFACSFAYGNTVYLANMAASLAADGSITASFNIAGGTNFVPYDILTTTNLAAPIANWNWIGIGYSSNYYSFTEQPGSVGFYMLAQPSKTMTVGFGNDLVGQCDVPLELTNAVQVAGGGGQGLALLNNGTVVAWGANYYGEGVVPTNLAGVAMVAAGWYHDVAMLTNGTVTAWGMEDAGAGYTLTNVPANLTNAVVISAQALHTLALQSNGTVVAWGYGNDGENTTPAGLTNVTAISAGYQFNLAVSNGTVVAWGDNTYHQCTVPPGLTNVVDVAAGLYQGLALLNNGTVAAWGDDLDGETDVPIGLTNVVAIAAGGDADIDTAYSVALRNDGTVFVWGDDQAVDPVGGLSHVIGISAGADNVLALRTGPPTPVITLEPTDEYQLPGGNATFIARGTGLDGVSYQWQFTNVDILGATNTALTVTNVQPAQLGSYDVVVTDNRGMGSITSSNANLYFVTVPVINSTSLPADVNVLVSSSVTLDALASAPGQNEGFPLFYQWQFDGVNLPSDTSSNLTFTAASSGVYSVIVSNAAGTVTNFWQVYVLAPGAVAGWGDNYYGQTDPPIGLTNAAVIATGEYHSVGIEVGGTVFQWGRDWASVPADLTNAVAVAAGYEHSIAVRRNGTVETWGSADALANYVPTGLAGVAAVAAGWDDNVALLTNETVLAWGWDGSDYGYGNMTNVPAGLTNATAISAQAFHALALTANGTVVAWGDDGEGESEVPPGLTNVVSVAAGGEHSLALLSNGTVKAWGWNDAGQCNVPLGLSNVMAIAAGWEHSVALLNNGTIVSWGDPSQGQLNEPASLPLIKTITASGDHTLAGLFSPLVQYPVNVAQDLLLIYNTNSVGSTTVMNYYLQNRPMVSGANVLGIGCTNSEIVGSVTFSNQILAPYMNWLTNNPTKHPQYLVLFMDIPSRVDDTVEYPSVQYQLSTNTTGIQPFVTSINMNGVNGSNDCIAYINKLVSIATNYSPGKLIISASAGGYGNTNYIVDDVNNAYCGDTWVPVTTNGLIAAGVSPSAIQFLTGCETGGNLPHLTNAVNVAGYISWGFHSSLGWDYATNGTIRWSGNSGWWIIRTEESYNGQRAGEGGNVLMWFSSNAFGGTNYSNTPVGAISYVEEPGATATDSSKYFGLWASGKNLAICAWNSMLLGGYVPVYQTVGDPFVVK